ncbi:hypothetical protein X766_15845 [Mesorhizobium sp. LSJC255A00]|uniref:hypothetical protein n=1 Tax=Mesorhizobium sp. LSJC255A00 TaxID=1287313 RepID=UPI0003CF8B86|nr:hypothetical protein [Mesorhizobium sp. LSJC255A00]ESX17872.1 hypothetical protein X766_15845 [Mesorhizobium sp. LSJC255A00]
MGTIVAVASVPYNLAGDEVDRPSYLKSLVVRNVLSRTKASVADDLKSGYLNGPAMTLTQFFRWARNPANYNQVGIPTGEMNVRGALDAAVVAAYVPHGAGEIVLGQNAFVTPGDVALLAEQWVLANRPDDIDQAWTAEFIATTSSIKITWPDTTTTTISAAGFSASDRYVAIYYSITAAGSTGSVITGSTVTLAPGDPYPDTTGWTLVSSGIYRRTTVTEGDDAVTQFIETMYQFDDGTTRSYRIDTQTNVYPNYGNTQLWIYEIGSGNAALDALAGATATYGQFFPFIPFRLENQFLSETYYPDAYAQIKKAYKKATGNKLSELIDKVADNESLGDIDHAYVVFGVSLNVIEPECRKYIYNFFKQLMQSQLSSPNYSAYLTQLAAHNAAVAALAAWQANPVGTKPALPAKPTLPTNTIKIKGTGEINSRYNIQLSWNTITETTGTGLAKPDAKSGDVWLAHTQTDDIYQTYTQSSRDNGDRLMTVKVGEIQHMKIWWQRTATSYTVLEVIGCEYRNYVYNSHAVIINTKEAIQDTDESGFIIPLHYDVWRATSLVSASQMSTACMFVVFNCYKVKKTKWYQSGIFRIFLIIVIAIVSAIFTAGGGFGILGANLLIGTSLGFTGLTAAIVGSLVNAFAALIISTLLQTVLGRLGIIGQVLSFVFMFVAGQIAAGFNAGALTIQWGDLLRADNLMKLMDSVGNGVADMLRNSALEMQQDWADFAKNAKAESAKIQQAYFNEFGYGAGVIDPFMFVDSSNGPIAESSDTFLTRTLMTGSDISGMSQELLAGFAEYSLTLPNAFT